jgi:hypothetical protein
MLSHFKFINISFFIGIKLSVALILRVQPNQPQIPNFVHVYANSNHGPNSVPVRVQLGEGKP